MLKICSLVTGERLDRFISEIFKLSRRKVSFLSLNNCLKVNNKPVKKSYILRNKDEITVEIRKFGKKYDYNKLKIVWENKDFLAIYKPPKFHSEKFFKSQYSVEDYIEKLNENFILVNRLDYQTQGLLLVAKNINSYKKIKELENKLEVKKFYIGISKGHINKKTLINNMLYAKNNVKVEVLNKTSKNNLTKIIPIAIYNGFSVLAINIFKGARHQIRAHLSYIKKPLLYDNKYSEKKTEDNYFLFCYGYKIEKIKLEIFDYKLLKKKFREFLLKEINL